MGEAFFAGMAIVALLVGLHAPPGGSRRPTPPSADPSSDAGGSLSEAAPDAPRGGAPPAAPRDAEIRRRRA